MPSPVNQFYYAHGGRPILKTVYDDGSEDFYDASGQFPNMSWGSLTDGTVFDPYADMAQQQADQQYGEAVRNAPAGQRSPTIFGQPPSQNYAVDALGNTPGLANPQRGTNPVQNPWPPANRPGAAPPQVPAPQQPPQPGQPQQPPQAPVPPGSAPPQDQRYLTEYERYNYADNPQLAMMNAFRDLGWSTYNNPYVQRLLQAAPGLAVSYLGQRGLGSANWNDVGASYGDYGQFLRNAIQGNNVMSTLGGAQGMFPQIVNAVRGHDQTVAQQGDGAFARLNPFLSTLSGMMGASTGQGAMGMYGNLFSPFMAPGVQRSYRGILDSAFLNSQRGFQQSGNRQTRRSVATTGGSTSSGTESLTALTRETPPNHLTWMAGWFGGFFIVPHR